jgi:two-component sensor histidine kinase
VDSNIYSRYARVKSALNYYNIPIAITSFNKPEIGTEYITKWQKLIDLLTGIVCVPSGLITRLSEEQLEILLTNSSPDNPVKPDIKLNLGMGWYSETAAVNRDLLVVSNALKITEWKENPCTKYNIISYMGMPILWPDGEVFGTFCLLDKSEKQYTEEHKSLLKTLLEIIENDLRSALLFQKIQNDVVQKELELREVHHCIKNQFNLLLSTIYLQSKYNPDKLEDLVTDIQARIKSISILHDKLCHSINMNEIPLGDYLNELGKFVIETMSSSHISFRCISEVINVTPNVSINCGLILNELITNSLKYAFVNTEKPDILVTIYRQDENHLLYSYRDNGTGLPDTFTAGQITSLGTKFIEQEVKQLDGSYEISGKDGFEFNATLKIS